MAFASRNYMAEFRCPCDQGSCDLDIVDLDRQLDLGSRAASSFEIPQPMWLGVLT